MPAPMRSQYLQGEGGSADVGKNRRAAAPAEMMSPKSSGPSGTIQLPAEAKEERRDVEGEKGDQSWPGTKQPAGEPISDPACRSEERNEGQARNDILAHGASGKMRDPQMQWRMVGIGEGQAAGDRDRVAFIDPKPKQESKENPRDGEPNEDRDGETIVLPIRHSARLNMQRVAERRERRLVEGFAHASDGHGWCRRCLPAARPSRAPGRRRRTVPRRPAPTAWMPSTRWLSARATTRTKPLVACSVMARPLARNGKMADA